MFTNQTFYCICSDTHGWLLSKYVEGKGITDDISTLAVKEKSFQTYGILCETGNCHNLGILVTDQYIITPKKQEKFIYEIWQFSINKYLTSKLSVM